jgi:hypothetical protein
MLRKNVMDLTRLLNTIINLGPSHWHAKIKFGGRRRLDFHLHTIGLEPKYKIPKQLCHVGHLSLN